MDRFWTRVEPPVILWSLWVIVFALASAMFPRDASYDVVHYHIHNGWSALEGRLDRDLAPAELHGFLNPAYNLWVYWLIVHLPGRIVAMILSIPQALILPALFYLTRNLVERAGGQVASGLLLAVAATGFLAEPQMTLFASVRNDTWGALGFLVALALVVPARPTSLSLWRFAGASLILGFMMGLKPTNLVYTVGFAITVMVLVAGVWPRVKVAAVCGLSGFAGTLLGGGPWALALWRRYDNPVFPLANGFFGAPLGPDGSWRDVRYLPDGIWDGLARPFTFFFDGSLINEHHFFDARFLLGYLSALGLIGLGLFARRFGLRPPARPAMALALGLLGAVIAWTFLFSIERYISAAWMLGPSLALLLWVTLSPHSLNGRSGLYGILVGGLALILTTQPISVRRAHWQSLSEPYVWAQLPTGFQTEEAIVMFSGEYPSAFTALAFPESVTLTHGAAPALSAPALENYRPQINNAIWASDQNLFAVIYNAEEHYDETVGRLRQDHGLHIAPERCAYLETAFDTGASGWLICPVERLNRPDGV